MKLINFIIAAGSSKPAPEPALMSLSVEVEMTQEGLSALTVAKLQELCTQKGYAQTEWKSLNKQPLIDYILAKEAETAQA